MSNDSFNLLKQATQSRTLGNYDKAKEYLDRLLEVDPENHALWYEKSKLPILQEDNIIIKSRNVSLSTYQQLALPEKNYYLQQCGFDITEITEIEERLRIPKLVAEQRAKYLKIAIIYAAESEKAIYNAELDAITAANTERARKETRTTVFTGVLALIVSVATILLINTFHNAPFFQMPMNTIVVLLIPYALSITGMVLYTKAKFNRNVTSSGLVFNLLALIISNLSIINAIIIFIIK